MPSLCKGEKVPMSMGGHAVVLEGKPLGAGAQGEVYLVEHQGKRRALKWYVSSKIRGSPEFRKNLVRNAEAGPPSPYFVWPVDVSTDYKGGYGYVMELFPDGYEQFSDFLRTYRITKENPPRKVPVASTTALQRYKAWLFVTTPVTLPSSVRISTTSSWRM